MAYIYSYHLKDKKLRMETSLKDYEKIIIDVINNNFGANLKNIFVENFYFEFSLYVTVSANILRRIGRQLRYQLSEIDERYGFVRMKQTLYAIVYLEQKDGFNETCIEFVDSKLIDETKLFDERAGQFWGKVYNNTLTAEQKNINITNEMKNSHYVDIINSYKFDNITKYLDNDSPSIHCFLIKGYHRRYSLFDFKAKEPIRNIVPLEKCFDAGCLKHKDSIPSMEDNKDDYLEIVLIEKADDKLEEIYRRLKFPLTIADSIKALSNICDNGEKRKYEFQVYDVGQAQATSLAIKDEDPFLYFDYGMPYGENSHTKPNPVIMPTKVDTTIIISHIDKDHWFGISCNLNAYSCSWYIPDKQDGIQFGHVIAQIFAHGGTVQKITSDIKFAKGHLTCGGTSKKRPSRPTNNKHETGLSLRLEAGDMFNNKFNILIAGDQKYDYIGASQLNCLNLLIASHHGGSYCWETTCKCIPTASVGTTATVVYSCGNNNSYCHPSKEKDYISAGWSNYHSTTRGCYKKLILL